MDNLASLLGQEYEKCLSLIVSARRGDQRWLQVDAETGKSTDVTDEHLEALQETARSFVLMMNEVGLYDWYGSRPTKDWHFNGA